MIIDMQKKSAWAVDGATESNPGDSEYQGIELETGKKLFHVKIGYATNNITEFIALVHAFSLAIKEKKEVEIYSDSMTALAWFKYKKCNSSLEKECKAKELQLRAEKFLSGINFTISDKTITYNGIEILHWKTKLWGENPADFGRKI